MTPDDRTKALKCLSALSPARLSYDEWLRVGLAIKNSGGSASDWETWSRADSRYKEGECGRKWNSFRPTTTPVTVATLIELCREQGNVPDGLWEGGARSKGPGHAIGWDDIIGGHAEPAPTDRHWLQTADVPPPRDDFQTYDMIAYLKAVFEPDDLVGISASGYQKPGEDRWLPNKGTSDRTAQQLIDRLKAAGPDIGAVIGDTTEAGAWVRINPLDGKGYRDENVTRYRHALLEADEDDLATQLALIREMELPCSAIVHSGGKSIHAIVRVDAETMEEYRKRVDYLFATAEKFGLKADTGNRNPSRLTRLPGVTRGADKNPQYMISGPTGLASWEAWVEHVEDAKDDLPDPVNLAKSLSNPPALAGELIAGILRQGDKLVLTGPSKAGKSFALQQLSVAIAAGGQWFGWPVAKGRVLYVNLELREASCVDRFQTIYKALSVSPTATSDAIDLWHLRGAVVPLDKLAGKLIRRAKKRAYSAIIIDPIYKVATGDENEARDMGIFCNLIDKIAAALSCSIIYAHHHSKGSQGQKRAIDRASGSGVISRDADALVDLVELSLDKQRRETFTNLAASEAMIKALREQDPFALTDAEAADYIGKPQDIFLHAESSHKGAVDAVRAASAEAYDRCGKMSAWRVETVLREFAPKPPTHIWFAYPLHVQDDAGILKDAKADGEEPLWKKERAEKDRMKADESKRQKAETKALIATLTKAGEPPPKLDAIADTLGISVEGARKRIKAAGFTTENKYVIPTKKEA